MNHTITIDESQRQMIIQSLAGNSMEHPGWDYALSQIALLMDNQTAAGRPEIYQRFKDIWSSALNGPIKLDWVWEEQYQTYTARIPARDANGDGFVIIYAIKRPDYCDRGKWNCLVETEIVFGLDEQEGFPRYYFSLRNLQEEMASWVNARRMCKNALVKPAAPDKTLPKDSQPSQPKET